MSVLVSRSELIHVYRPIRPSVLARSYYVSVTRIKHMNADDDSHSQTKPRGILSYDLRAVASGSLNLSKATLLCRLLMLSGLLSSCVGS